MLKFMLKVKKDGDFTAVLGYPPYDGARYWLWRACRHPNYFFEWCCWVSFVIMALPSFVQLAAEQPAAVTAAYAVLLFYCPRMFYASLARPSHHPRFPCTSA